jgi:hypothetical protein
MMRNIKMYSYHKNRQIWLLAMILTGLVFALAGCKEEEGKLVFNHELHVVDNEMACADCHEAGDEGAMGNPSMDKCGECHDIDMDNPSDECLQCHTVKGVSEDYDTSESVPEKPESYEDVIFSHEFHDGIECSECHEGFEKMSELKDIEWPEMPTCQKCHNGDDAPSECSACHEVLSEEHPPASHHGDWGEAHGRESRFDRSCAYCHGKDKQFCQDCHQTQKPKDHIFNWKTTQHGEDATHDRRLCAVCHTSSYCSDCHTSQKPVSHARADWMSYTRENGHAEAAHHNFRSCNVCHTQAECAQCHNTIVLRQKK